MKFSAVFALRGQNHLYQHKKTSNIIIIIYQEADFTKSSLYIDQS